MIFPKLFLKKSKLQTCEKILSGKSDGLFKALKPHRTLIMIPITTVYSLVNSDESTILFQNFLG